MQTAVHNRTSIGRGKAGATAAATPLERSAADIGTMWELGGKNKAAPLPLGISDDDTSPAAALCDGNAGPVQGTRSNY